LPYPPAFPLSESVERGSSDVNTLKNRPYGASRPQKAIGQVDAIIVPTDKGHEHAERVQPFIEVGLPVFVDKPLVDNIEDMRA